MRATASVLINRVMARARLRHLQVLVSVSELGSFKRAAEAVGLTQPAVTHIVADLEQLLGAELFRRHARGVTPTDAALELLPAVRRTLGTLAEGIEALAARLADAEGVVRLAATASALSGLLDRLLPPFSQHAPGIHVQVLQADGDHFNGLVARGEVDAVACRRPSVPPQNWQFHPLVADELVVVAHPTHPLARRRRLRVAELADEVWLVPPADSLARRTLDALAEELAWRPRLAPVVTRALPLTWALLQRQRTVSLVPAAVVRQLTEAGQLVVLPLDRRWPIDDLGLLLPAEGAGGAVLRLLAYAGDHRAATG
ncbi:MAG: LysR family transcriptional regulator [Rubrivivax sp.]|nr:LysR family transcriptional regulator [Rubrivivax sp.]